MAEGWKVGGDVDAFCTRCKLVLGHTILAMTAARIARVRCNTCQGEHAYRVSAPGSGPARSRAPKAPQPPKPDAVAASYAALMEGKDRASARPYSPKDKFEEGELIEHTTFGVGVVAAVRGFEKVDVAFLVGAKTLVHNRGATPASARPPPPKFPDVVVEAGQEDPTQGTSDED